LALRAIGGALRAMEGVGFSSALLENTDKRALEIADSRVRHRLTACDTALRIHDSPERTTTTHP
jgi:hypothetical protein